MQEIAANPWLLRGAAAHGSRVGRADLVAAPLVPRASGLQMLPSVSSAGMSTTEGGAGGAAVGEAPPVAGGAAAAPAGAGAYRQGSSGYSQQGPHPAAFGAAPAPQFQQAGGGYVPQQYQQGGYATPQQPPRGQAPRGGGAGGPQQVWGEEEAVRKARQASRGGDGPGKGCCAVS